MIPGRDAPAQDELGAPITQQRWEAVLVQLEQAHAAYRSASDMWGRARDAALVEAAQVLENEWRRATFESRPEAALLSELAVAIRARSLNPPPSQGGV
jgi:hypothetical protein